MKKLITKNIIIIIFCFVLPQTLIYFIDRSYIILSFSDNVRSFFNYLSFLVPFFASIYLVLFNYKFLRRANIAGKAWPIIFIIFSILMMVYSIIMLMFLYGFRNGVGF